MLPIVAWGKDQAPVVKVTKLFKDDLPEFSAKRRLDASGVDKERTFVEEALAQRRDERALGTREGGDVPEGRDGAP